MDGGVSGASAGIAASGEAVSFIANCSRLKSAVIPGHRGAMNPEPMNTGFYKCSAHDRG